MPKDMSQRLRAALAIEQPHFEKMEGLRELFALSSPSARRDIMKMRLDEHTYNKWCSFSDLLDP
jgi:hypothetical protein